MGLLTDVIDRALRVHASRPAVSDAHRTLTFRDLNEAADRYRERIAGSAPIHGYDDGPARIALYARNSAEYVAAYIGVLRSGAVPFLVDPSFERTELGHVIDGCGVDRVLHDRELPYDRVTHGRELSDTFTVSTTERDRAAPGMDGDTEVCRFTSGSTGKPNGLEFSGAAVNSAAQAWLDGTGLSRDDKILCFAGLPNGLAFNTSLLPALLAGASVVFSQTLPSAGSVLALTARHRPSRLVGFPALFESLARRAATVGRLDEVPMAVSSGAPLRPETAGLLRGSLGLTIANYYGIAEAGPLTFDGNPDPERGLGPCLPGAKLLQIIEGTNQIQRVAIAASLAHDTEIPT